MFRINIREHFDVTDQEVWLCIMKPQRNSSKNIKRNAGLFSYVFMFSYGLHR